MMNTRMALPDVTTQMSAINAASNHSNSSMASGGMSPSTATTSPVSAGMIGMGSPHHQTNIGMKPGAQTPSPNVLQVVKQVQEEAARQQVPLHGGFGKVTPTGVQMPPPVMQRNMGVVPGHMGGVVGPGGVGVMQQQQQNQQGVVGPPMQGGAGGGMPGAGNLMSMDQWGNGNRYQNGNNPGIRPGNVQQMMPQQQQNPMQQVSRQFGR